jgi:hypothetical protein
MREATTVSDRWKVIDEKDKTANDNRRIICQAHKDRIDISVCIVRSLRQPEKCNSCPINL